MKHLFYLLITFWFIPLAAQQSQTARHMENLGFVNIAEADSTIAIDLGSATGDTFFDHRANDAYNVQGLFASWKPQQQYLKGTEVNFTLDNMFNRDYAPMLSDDNVYSTGRSAKVSVSRFF